jgi:phage repressor protein C with HTH and peptisase S24 domain
MSAGDRVKELRLQKNLKYKGFADLFGKKWEHIRDIERGKVALSPKFAADIGIKMGVSRDWLLYGRDTPAGTVQAAAISSDHVEVPLFAETYASMGGGAINYYDGEKGHIILSKEFLRGFLGVQNYNNIHVITAIGDSMEPSIHSGCLLFVLPNDNEGGVVVTGGIYVINVGGNIFVKRVEANPAKRKLTLRSDNEIYEPMVFEGDELDACVIIGRVIGCLNKK